MNSTYRFISDTEPSDKELAMLMKDVINDVKKRAKKAELNFKKLQILQINEAIKRQNLSKDGNV